ncbi:hypothetical protein ABFG93_07905 [Pseudalkalibacillus hwajinpoensis]|uniref:hypothetical protein n=1 Tax=Guptibacillus hwajinpoensis TaxID=208199 RepID=UPI00325BB9CA
MNERESFLVYLRVLMRATIEWQDFLKLKTSNESKKVPGSLFAFLDVQFRGDGTIDRRT